MKQNRIIIALLTFIIIFLCVIAALLLQSTKASVVQIPIQEDSKNEVYVCTKEELSEDEDGTMLKFNLKEVIEVNQIGQIVSQKTGFVYNYNSKEDMDSYIEILESNNDELYEKEGELQLYVYRLEEDKSILGDQWYKDILRGHKESGYECIKK